MQREVRRSFGIVFQDPSLDDELTAYENMDLHGILYGVPRAERIKRINMLVDFVGLADRKKDFVKTYSGGMKRRLEVARALLHKPRILFLDEPTVGLDPQTRNHIWGHIQGLSKEENVTVFFTTHYMEEADRVADDVAVIDDGKLVAQGAPADLKTKTQSAAARRRIHRAHGSRHPRRGSVLNGSHAEHAKNLERRWAAMRAIYILCLRQLKRYIRSPARIVGSLGQPILFLIGLGFGFRSMFARAGGGNYINFLAPGIISMAILFNAVFSGIEIIWDRQFGFLKETLVAPVSRLEIVFGQDPRRRNRTAMASGARRVRDLPDRRISNREFAAAPRGNRVYVPDRAVVHFDRHGHRFRAAGYAVEFPALIMNFLVMPLLPHLFLPALFSLLQDCRRRCNSRCA